VLLAPLLLGMVLLVLAGRAEAQTATTAPPAATAAPAPSTTAATAGDAASTRTVNRIVAILLALAVVLVGVAIWFWRATKPVARHLDGLDVMGTRRWHRSGSGERSTLLAPVHERRAESDADDVVAEPQSEVEPVEAGVDAEEEPTPRAS
jgi:hypothetical protein